MISLRAPVFTCIALFCSALFCSAAIVAAQAKPRTTQQVRVLQSDSADCGQVDASATIRAAHLGRAKRQITFAEIESALTRRARTRGFNAIKALRIEISSSRSQGVTALATAVRCHDTEPVDAPALPYDRNLKTIVESANSAELFEFDASSGIGRRPSVSAAQPRTLGRLSASQASALAALILNPANYETPSAFVTSCPFAPTRGIAFRSATGEAWWLIAMREGCNDAILAGADDDWRSARTIQLTQQALKDAEAIFRATE